jgi:hypothetical protein
MVRGITTRQKEKTHRMPNLGGKSFFGIAFWKSVGLCDPILRKLGRPSRKR